MRTLLKRAAAAVLTTAVLATTLLASGCSTPKTAITVDGTSYSTGEYLAYLYNSFYQIYVNQGLYYYDLSASSTYDVWNQTYTYSEDEETEYNLADYMRRSAKDSIIRQVAVQRLLTQYGLSISEEDEAALNEQLASLKADAYIEYGFNNESYARMYREYNLNEKALFLGLYDKGGAREVPEADVRAYFDENYLSYEMISYALVDSDGKALSDEELKKISEDLDGYLKMFQDGTGFDDVIAQQKKDAAGESETKDSTSTETETDSDTDTSTTSNNRVDIDSSQSGDKELVTALKEMSFGEAKIIEYSTDSGTKTKALVLRMDPEKDRGNDADGNPVDYYANQRNTILYQLKSEELNTEIEEKVATLSVDANERVMKKCDPYEFRSMLTGN